MVINLLLSYRPLQLVKWSFLSHPPIHPSNSVLCISNSPVSNEGKPPGLVVLSIFRCEHWNPRRQEQKKSEKKKSLKTLYICQQSLWAALLLLTVVNFAIFFKHNLQVSCGGVWRVVFYYDPSWMIVLICHL